MEAIVLKQHGGLENISYTEIDVPVPGPNEVLVELKAAALNRLDLWVLEGWPGLNLRFPHILGCDGAGVIVKIGTGVNDFSVGDAVAINPTRSCGQCAYCLDLRDNLCDKFAIFGEHIPGFFAQYQVVPVRNLLRKPDEISFEVTAAASLVYVTAWHSLIEIGRFKQGEDILIIGAGGGVNTAYIDIARYIGAKTIYVVGSTNRKLAVARNQGADITINRHDQNWSKFIYEATDRKGVDIVVDNVGEPTFQNSIRALKKGGRLLTVGNTSGYHVNLDNRFVFSRHLHILGSTMGPIQAYRDVMARVFKGDLKPAIDETYPLEDGISALKRLKAGKVAGKLVLVP